MRLPAYFVFLGIFSACGPDSPERGAHSSFASFTSPDEFAAYWFQGKAELASYDLTIQRYGEPRQGDAILIFVTEDLSAAKQVKLDNPQQAGDDKIPVLKLNKIWKFKTGIYDYSLMESLFTPIDPAVNRHSLKQTSTFQDWCGHGFQQLNWEKNAYQGRLFSYFESEGDQSFKVKPDLLEDELFNLIRLDPARAPSGEVDLLPGAFFIRLAHQPIEPKRARIQFLESEATTQCLVEYLHMDRTLRIHFETAFPHRILSWTEEKSGEIVVEARLRNVTQSPYWAQNAAEFLPLRDSMQLNF